jgi:hypothetical protein
LLVQISGFGKCFIQHGLQFDGLIVLRHENTPLFRILFKYLI